MDEDGQNFDTWLCRRLQELKTDEAVFGPYIKSILEGDEDFEEKIEGLDGLLVELGGDINAETLRNEILKRWDETINSSGKSVGSVNANPLLSNGASVVSGAKPSDSASTEQQLIDRLLNLATDNSISSGSDQASSSSTGLHKELNTPPDPALRAAILSNYRVSDSDSEDDDDAARVSTKKKSLEDEIGKNVNCERAQNEQRELREISKQDAAKKREKDREDRAKQKQAAQDRKDKAKKKATKVERKR